MTQDIADLTASIQAFARERDWEQFNTPKNLACALTVESGELLEHFQWLTIEQSSALMADPAKRAEVADELADVLIYCLSFANCAGIEVGQAIQAKLARNEVRFPVAEVRGRY